MTVAVGPHRFRPLRFWDLRREGRCRHCYAPRWAHPIHCYVKARPMYDKSPAELTFEALHPVGDATHVTSIRAMIDQEGREE